MFVGNPVEGLSEEAEGMVAGRGVCVDLAVHLEFGVQYDSEVACWSVGEGGFPRAGGHQVSFQALGCGPKMCTLVLSVFCRQLFFIHLVTASIPS